MKKKIGYKCLECGHIMLGPPNGSKDGTRCEKCKGSLLVLQGLAYVGVDLASDRNNTTL